MGRIRFRGGTMLAPLPTALVTVKDGDSINAITIGWTGILSTQPPKTYISVRPSRYSYQMLKNSGEFVINLTTAGLTRAADYCGVFTGRKVNKFEKCGLTPVPSEEVAAPTIAESPLSLECRVTDVIPLGSHDMFIADIVAVTADEAIVDKNGKLRLDRADLAAYAHGEYFALGKRIGAFGFSAAKKKKKTRSTAPRKEKKPREKQ